MATDNRLLNAEEVMNRIGLKRTALYNLVRRGDFPRPLRIGVRATRWPSLQIDQWIESRPLAASGPEDQTQAA